MSRLVNRTEVKRYLLERARLLRPALGMKRVSNAAVYILESKLRLMADELIRQHPSMGRTIKPQRQDADGLMDEQLETFSVRVRDAAVFLAERGLGVSLFFQLSANDPLICPHCQHRMRVLAVIDQRKVIEKILLHLDLWSGLPALFPLKGGLPVAIPRHWEADDPQSRDPFPDYDNVFTD